MNLGNEGTHWTLRMTGIEILVLLGLEEVQIPISHLEVYFLYQGGNLIHC